jgi:HlyD family secretion protein
VVSRSVDVGQTVAASFQTPTLFQIAQDLTKMQVDASVSESDIGSVGEGQPAVFSVDAFPGREFRGAVVQVRNAPVTLQNVVTYDVVIAVNNPDLALKPGMTATVTITTGQRDDVLRVALRALSFSRSRRYPWPCACPQRLDRCGA